MNALRNTLLVGACLAVLASPAWAQPKPMSVAATIPARVATYHAGILGLVPAASGTDFFTIQGSATNVVRVKSIECSGTTTAAATIAVQMVRRSTADTTGTSTTLSMVPSDTSDPASTALVKAYTVNPGALGTIVGGPIRTGMLTTTTVASSAIEQTPQLGWVFGLNNDKEPTLRGVAQTLALNLNAASISAGALIACDVEYTETLN